MIAPRQRSKVKDARIQHSDRATPDRRPAMTGPRAVRAPDLSPGSQRIKRRGQRLYDAGGRPGDAYRILEGSCCFASFPALRSVGAFAGLRTIAATRAKLVSCVRRRTDSAGSVVV